MAHAVTINRLPVAFDVMKAMRSDRLVWGEDYRPLARKAVVEIIEAE